MSINKEDSFFDLENESHKNSRYTINRCIKEIKGLRAFITKNL